MIIRKPTNEELPRAVWFFRHRKLPPETTYIVAQETVPRQRFLGALALWENNFLIACQPGLEMLRIAPGLLDALFKSGLSRETIRYHAIVSEKDPLFTLLRDNGFKIVNRVRFFDVELAALRPRLTEVFAKTVSLTPQNWRFLPLYSRPASEVRALVVDRYRLMGGGEFDQCVHSGSFDPSLSTVLWDGTELLGVFLIVRTSYALMVEAVAVTAKTSRLRAVGNVGLLHASLINRNPDDSVTRYEFRAGATDHVQTANTALRLGGRELPVKMSLEKKLEV